MLPYDSFTYVSDAHGSTSWLDHVVCSRDMPTLIKHVFILDKLPSSDHLLLSTVFNITFNDNVHIKNIHCADKKVIKWCDASRGSLVKYECLLRIFY